MIPADETDAVTFFGAAGMLYCSAELAAGVIARVAANRAKTPINEIFLFIFKTSQFPFNRGLTRGKVELNTTRGDSIGIEVSVGWRSLVSDLSKVLVESYA